MGCNDLSLASGARIMCDLKLGNDDRLWLRNILDDLRFYPERTAKLRIAVGTSVSGNLRYLVLAEVLLFLCALSSGLVSFHCFSYSYHHENHVSSWEGRMHSHIWPAGLQVLLCWF